MPKNYQLYLRGSVGGWNFDSDYISYVLDKHKDAEINVLINSLGGDANAGLTINSLFKIHGNVHVHFVGCNASAATIAAMGAKRVSIDASATFLVHKCLNAVCDWDWKNADQLEARIVELQKLKDDLNAIDSVVAGLYARRCKKTKDEAMALMKAGGWLTPQQALDWGFVDEITDLEEDEKPVLTEAMASAIASAGMPMPPLKLEKDSFFDRLRNLFASIMPGSQTSAQTAGIDDSSDNPDNKPNSKPNSKPMKTFALIAAALGGTFSASGSKAELEEAQLDKIEASLSAKDAEISTLKADAQAKQTKIDELEAAVADLRKAPAARTGQVNETSGKQDTDGPGEDIDAVVAEFAKAFMA